MSVDYINYNISIYNQYISQKFSVDPVTPLYDTLWALDPILKTIAYTKLLYDFRRPGI